MNVDNLVFINFLSGAICALSFVGAFFFYRAWLSSKDSLFYWFGWAFALIAIERLFLTFSDPALEYRPFFYLMRLVAFSSIIFGIWRKNQGRARSEAS